MLRISFAFVISVAYLYAEPITSVSITAGGRSPISSTANGSLVSVEVSDWNEYMGELGYEGSAEADGAKVNVNLYSGYGFIAPIEVEAYVKDEGIVTLPEGMTTMSFSLNGIVVQDGTGVDISYTFSSSDYSEIFHPSSSLSCHYCYVNEIFTTQPFMVTTSLLPYTIELKVNSSFNCDGWAMSGADLESSFLGANEVPEPSSMLLLGSGLFIILIRYLSPYRLF